MTFCRTARLEAGADIAAANSNHGGRTETRRKNSFCRPAGHSSAGESRGRLRKSRRRGTDAARRDTGREGRSHPHERPRRGAGVHDDQRGRRGRGSAGSLGVCAAALFTNQIPAFEAAPSVYEQRAYFQTFADATENARKYILLVTNTQDVVIFDLEDKIREDLLDLNVPNE